MTEYARLVLSVDSTSGLKAASDLDRLEAASRKAEGGFDQLERQTRRNVTAASQLKTAVAALGTTLAAAVSATALRSAAGLVQTYPALGVAAAAAALSYQAAQAAGINSISLSGMAHDGIDSVPKEGTWLLDKGERVVDRRTNSDLKDYLADRKGGGGAPQITIHAPVTVEGQAGMSEQEMRKQGQVTADTINAVVMTKIERESRPGGLLWNLYGAGR
ncbi:MAG: hypothetical protein FH750_12380 [Pseudomonas stutzeri]|nr:hypothetical protein [Stutzerimonas stutzeri]